MKNTLDRLMPGYSEQMPAPKSGRWRAATELRTPNLGTKGYTKKYKPVFSDIRGAYRYARLRALIRDWFTMGSGWGVDWIVFRDDPSN